MALSPADRVQLGLDDPPPHGDSEFAPTSGASLVPAPGRPPPNLKLVLKEGERATTPRIRSMVNELLAGNVDNANYWLQQVAAANPKVALELFIEMAQFSLPKLKAVAVQVDDRNAENPRALSFAQLQQVIQGE